MGMSASQARLLSITARLNDVEYKSQNIANIKIRLADESERLALNYSKALGQQKYTYTTYASGSAQKIDLTLKNLYQTSSRYQLRSANGKMALPKQFYNAFKVVCDTSRTPGSWANRGKTNEETEGRQDDLKHAFVQTILGVSNTSELCSNNGLNYSDPDSNGIVGGHRGFYGEYQFVVDNAPNCGFTMDDIKYWESLYETLRDESGKGTIYNTYGYQKTTYDTSNVVNLSGANENDPAWLYNAIESGEFILVDTVTGEEVTVSNTVALAIETDTSKYAIAEAEYNAANMKINNKEKLLDNELKKLDTEHNALQTEMDSIKNLIGKNIEKSFNLFS